MTTEKNSIKTKVSSRGGARPNAGRPKGSGNKITVNTLLDKAAAMGMPFEEAILMDWATAPLGSDLRYKYNQLLFNKIVADRHQIEVDDTTTVENRQQAFLKALEVIGGVAITQDEPVLTVDTVAKIQRSE
jgi:hypothetical protein